MKQRLWLSGFLVFFLLCSEMTVQVNAIKYKTGIKCRWMIPGDILWLISSLKNNKNRLEIIKDFSKFREMNYDILTTKDIMPLFGATKNLFNLLKEVINKKRNISGEIIQ